MRALQYYMSFIIILALFMNTNFKTLGIEEIKKREKNKKIYVFICVFILFLISALKSKYYTDDYLFYFTGFENNLTQSYDEIIRRLSVKGTKDPCYTLAGWFFGQIIPNAYIWLGLLAALYCGSIGYFIYKNSKVPLLSIIMFVALGYYWFSLTGIRQALAMTFTVFSYKYIKERKPLKFVLCVLFGSLFHQTALVFLIAYPLSRLKFGFKHIIAFAALVVIFIFYQSWVREFLYDVLGSELRYDSYINEEEGVLNVNGFIIQACIFLYCLFYYKKAVADDENNIALYNLIFIGLAFYLFVTQISVMFRVGIYFTIFSMALVPNVTLMEENKRGRTFFQLLIGGVLLLYLFYVSPMYFIFFWEV